MIIPSWDAEDLFVHELAPVYVPSCEVWEAEPASADTGLLDHLGQPIRRRSPLKAKLGFHTGP